MSRALRGGVPRMFRRHSGQQGRWFRDQYLALEQKHGPFEAVSRHYAGAAAVLWCEFRHSTLELEEAERARRKGKGRRPSLSLIARLKKRHGLAWQSYDSALEKLKSIAPRHRPKTFADSFRAASEQVS